MIEGEGAKNRQKNFFPDETVFCASLSGGKKGKHRKGKSRAQKIDGFFSHKMSEGFFLYFFFYFCFPLLFSHIQKRVIMKQEFRTSCTDIRSNWLGIGGLIARQEAQYFPDFRVSYNF